MEGPKNTNNSEKIEQPIERTDVTIVAEQVLSQRLLAINDQAEFQLNIYPYLLRVAGEKLPPIAIAGIITLAMDRFTFGDRTKPTSQLVRMYIPHLVDAMLDDHADRNAVMQELRV